MILVCDMCMEQRQCIVDADSRMPAVLAYGAFVLLSLFLSLLGFRHWWCQKNGMDEKSGESSDGTRTRDDGKEPDVDHKLKPKPKVFLCHSGAQKSFVDDLCSDLMRRDRYPFFDKLRSSLPIGEQVPECIFDAIKQCEVGVVVLSEEFFTKSMWPMLELVAMVEESRKPNRRIKIMPVFLGISRDKCRDRSIQSKWVKQWKVWARDTRKGKIKINVEDWLASLEIFGPTSALVKGEKLERELRAEIVEAVCKEVVPQAGRCDGLDVEGKSHICTRILEMVYQKQQSKENGVRVVGLYGVGGIGKTTACMALCDWLSTEYCRVCHAELGRTGEETLLRKVLAIVTDLDSKFLDELDANQCHGVLKTRVLQQKIFLALDNVSDESMEQAERYLKANFGDGSVVLVTARTVHILKSLGIDEGDCLAMPELEFDQAKSLFLKHAILQSTTQKIEVEETLVKQCVEKCYFSKGEGKGRHYHPLALKVLGGELRCHSRDPNQWTKQLGRIDTFNLSRRREHSIFSILRSSFDSLKDEDQLLFLDVALFLPEMFFIDWDSRTLLRRLLAEGTVFDFVTVFAWLAMLHGKRKLDDVEYMLDGLKRKSLLENFGGTQVGMHDLWREFAKAELKDGKFSDRRWIYEKDQPCNGTLDLKHLLKVEVLKLFDVADEILDLTGLKHLKSLEIIPIHDSFKMKVNGLGSLERLTYLLHEGISSSACIKELGCLTSLQVVVLGFFGGDELPDMSKLTNLRVLDLSYATSLKRVCVGNLTNLTALNLAMCRELRKVDISGCRWMIILNLFGSYALEELNVSSCPLIHTLDLGSFRMLRKLDISGCWSIRKLNTVTILDKLEELRATECENLAELPDISELLNLRVLEIEPMKVPSGFQLKPLRVLE